MNFETSTEIDKIAVALAKFQGDVKPVPKDKIAKIPGRDGRVGYEYSYADLATIIEATKEERKAAGLAVTQWVIGEGEVTIITLLLHTSGQWIKGWLTLEPADGKPQTIGALVSYMRRYTYSAPLGISTEDDDGNSAQDQAATIRQRERREPAGRFYDNASPKGDHSGGPRSATSSTTHPEIPRTTTSQSAGTASKHHEHDPVIMAKITRLLNELGWAKPHAVNWLKKHFQADTFASLTADKVERVAEKLEMEAEAAKAEVERKAAAATKGQTT